MTALVFSRTDAGQDLFWLHRSTGGSARAVCFLPAAASSGMELSLTAASWGGAIVFLGDAPPADLSWFRKSLWERLGGKRLRRSLAWLTNPNDAQDRWRLQALTLNGDLRVEADATITVGDHALHLPAGLTFQATPNADVAALSSLTDLSGQRAFRRAEEEGGGWVNGLKAIFSYVTHGAREVRGGRFTGPLRIDLAGPAAGRLVGEATFDSAEDFDELGTGLRHQIADQSLHFPLLRPTGHTRVLLSLDVLAPEQGFGELREGQTVQSGYLTRGGSPLELLTVTGTAHPRGPRISFVASGARWSGPFTPRVPAALPAGEEHRAVMCGLGGDEVLVLGNDAGFVFEPVPHGETRVRVTGAGSTHVRHFGGGPAELRTRLDGLATALPLIPYAFTAADPVLCRLLEQQLVPLRTAALTRPAGIKAVARSYVKVVSTPPKTSEAPAEPEGWRLLRDTKDGPCHTAIFGDPAGPFGLDLLKLPPGFAKALATDLLAEDGVGLADAEATLRIAGERLPVPLAEWSRHGAVLVVKAAGGSALKDLLAKNPLPVAKSAMDRLEACAGQGDADAARLWKAVFANPRWHGIVLLDVPLTTMPAALRAVWDGVAVQFAARGATICLAFSKTRTGKKWTAEMGPAVIDFTRPVQPVAEHHFTVGTGRVTASCADSGTWRLSLPVTMEKLLGQTVRPSQAPLCLDIETNDGATGATLRQRCTVPFENAVVQAMVFDSARLPGSAGNHAGKLRIGLSGTLGFCALSPDLFSYGGAKGGLPFSGLDLVIDRSGSNCRISLDAASLRIDARRAEPRPGSFQKSFPVDRPELVYDTEGREPQKLGYIGIASPVAKGTVGAGWYGLRHRLELGSLGALASNAGLTADLLVAWQPGDDTGAVQLGLKLPGSTSGEPEIAIARMLRLSFGAISLDATSAGGKWQYVLRLEDARLTLFDSAKFPGGRMDLLLFGDPDGSTSGPRLGWFAAYDKDPSMQSKAGK